MNFLKRVKYFNISNFICSKIGHRWKYHFSLTDYHNKGRKVRSCKRCFKTQILKDFATNITRDNVIEEWSTMIGCTDLGAKKKFKPEHLKD